MKSCSSSFVKEKKEEEEGESGVTVNKQRRQRKQDNIQQCTCICSQPQSTAALKGY